MMFYELQINIYWIFLKGKIQLGEFKLFSNEDFDETTKKVSHHSHAYPSFFLAVEV